MQPQTPVWSEKEEIYGEEREKGEIGVILRVLLPNTCVKTEERQG